MSEITPLTATQVKEQILAAERVTAGREVGLILGMDEQTLFDCMRANIYQIKDKIEVFGYELHFMLKTPGLSIHVCHEPEGWLE